MPPELRQKCVAAGMDESLDDAAALAWLNANGDKVFAVAPAEPGPVAPAVEPASSDDVIATAVDKAVAKIEAKREAKTKAHRDNINSMVELAFGGTEAISKAELQSLYGMENDPEETVRAAVIDLRAKASSPNVNGGRIDFSANQPRDQHIAALNTALSLKCLNVAGHRETEKLDKYFPAAERSKDWTDFQHHSLVDLSRECLMADGYSYNALRSLTPEQIAKAALGYPTKVGLPSIHAAYHDTGTLSLITQDAVNKSLRAGYDEAPQTWRGPGRQGESVADFKDIHRIKLGAAGNLPVWPDNIAPELAALSNEEEKYAVEARAETITFSWRLIINDDLSSLSRTPAVMGDAAARTVNSFFWNIVTSNPAMADGQNLFSAVAGNRKRSNLAASGAAPTTATVGSLKSLMRLMRGLNTPEGNESDDVLNLTPRFIVGPAALEQTIMVLVRSGADPAANLSSAVFNTAGTLTPIIEPLLDANSSTAWYLFADPARIDTIEITFLQGHETPVTHDWMDDKTMSRNFTIIQTFGGKAIDHRGVAKDPGA